MGQTRVYSYNANPPVENLGLVMEQMRGLNRFRNERAKLEIWKRRLRFKETRALDPSLSVLDSQIEDLKQQRREIRRQKSVENIRRRSKKARPEAKRTIKSINSEIRRLKGQAYTLENKALRTEEGRKRKKFMNTLQRETEAKMRSESKERGLFWPNYCTVERVEAKAFAKWRNPPPNIKRWDGSGRIAVRTTTGPHTEAEILDGNNNWVRLEIVSKCIRIDTERSLRRGTPKRKLGNAWLRLRVQSDDSGNPVWTKIPFYYDRPLPDRTQIRWVFLVRKRVGRHYRWRVQFVLRAETVEPFLPDDLARIGAVGLDIGWRRFPGEGVRVCVWAGSDGKEGELRLPEWWVAEMEKVCRIQAERDRLFNVYAAWIWKIRGSLPERLQEMSSHAYAWKDKKRLHTFLRAWREEGGSWSGYGPSRIEALDGWRRRELHLRDYERHLEDQLQASRKHLYQQHTADLSRLYATAVIEDFDLSGFHRNLPVEYGGTYDRDASKVHLRYAALSIWRDIVRGRFRETLEVPAENTSLRCHGCGRIDKEWPKEKRHLLVHSCPNCPSVWDQDVNAARNLLASSAGDTTYSLDPLAPRPITTFRGESGPPELHWSDGESGVLEQAYGNLHTVGG